MSSTCINTVSNGVPNSSLQELAGNGNVGFVVFATALITFAFSTPFVDSWRRSAYDQTAMDELAEIGAREGYLDRKIALGALAAFGLVSIMWPGGKAIRASGVFSILCAAYLAWCAASCLWSDDSVVSLRRFAAFACEVIAGVAIAKRTSAYQFVWIVFAATSAWLGLGFVAELSQGTFQPWDVDHRFAGIFHPNTMGVNVSILILASLYLGLNVHKRRWLLFMVATAAFIFLVLTRSRTSTGAMFVAVAASWFIMATVYQKIVTAWIFGIASSCLIIAASLSWFDVSSDFVTMERDNSDVSTFTGRVPIWQKLLTYASDSPWAGRGYGGFWTQERITEMYDPEIGVIPHAHQSYLDLILNIGLVGAVLCFSIMVIALLLASRREAQFPRAGYGLIAAIIVYVLAGGLLETYLGITSFLSFFVVCGICYLLFDADERCSPSLAMLNASFHRPMPLANRGNKTI